MGAVDRDRRVVLCLGGRLTFTDGLPLTVGGIKDIALRLARHGMRLGELSGERVSELGLGEEMKERITALLSRGDEWKARLKRYENSGIATLTYIDGAYPRSIAEASPDGCPPVLFCYGDVKILSEKSVGYVGVRDCDEQDIDFTRNSVFKTVATGFGVTSGGARGIDCAAEFAALEAGANVCEFTSGAFRERLAFAEIRSAADNGRMVIASSEVPEEGFSSARAMSRNAYIYMQSAACVVVRSHLKRGGTWSGAVRNLKKGWCPLFCRDYAPYLGNAELISMGAKPIDENWDGDTGVEGNSPEVVQLNMFDDKT